jgi:myo-inositol-1(or 4)-monophosphatase
LSLQKELDFASDIARQAGKMIRDGFGVSTISIKQDQTPVTDVDVAVNKLFIEEVARLFPGDRVIGEEQSNDLTSANRTWLVDPIDGTLPYTAGAPLSTFTANLVIDGRVRLGAVYDPFMDRLLIAVEGQPSMCNGHNIAPRSFDESSKMSIYIGNRVGKVSKELGEIIDECGARGIRIYMYGSGAYGVMQVALGLIDAAITTADPEGLGAADLILRQAGGLTSDFYGDEWSVEGRQNRGFIAVSSPEVMSVVQKIVRPKT